ncbi:MAG: hypothetical protein Q7R43_00780 [Candidatus Daviesbacteria bacterium]|nr:hypothetical protein [Candidatus Daviesbacteria bacterium]
MKIGFDLDRIFINLPPIIPPGVIDWLYKKHCQKGLAYSIPKSSLSKLIRRASHISPLRPPIKKNINTLSQILLQPNLELYLISSRYKFLEKLTLKLLNKYNLITPFSKIYLNTSDEQPHLFKEKVLKKLNLDLFIDDDLDLLKHLQKQNLKTKLIWYNTGHKINETQGIIAISNFSEIIKFIK